MKLRHWDIARSSSAGGYVRLEGEVVYADRPSRPEVYWIEVEARFARYLSESGNPWLACLLPLATALHEPLQLPMPVDMQLRENAEQLMRIWASWYPERQAIPIEADIITDDKFDNAGKSGVFFSGGVDSFFTTLHYDEQAASSSHPPADDLLTVWGYDIPIDNSTAFGRVQENASRVSRHLKKESIVLKTNARETRLRQMPWLSIFGSLLIGVGLSLERRYARIMISSAEGREHQKPISGSHPQTDPLFSTSRTTVVHYGVDHDRFERTAMISRSEIAMDSLRVCWESDTGENCGKCDKCVRTMATLDLLECLQRCSTFPVDGFDLGRIEGIYSSEQRAYYLSLREHARARDRMDVVDAIDKSLVRSRQLDRWTQLPRLRRADQMLRSAAPVLWGALWPIRVLLKAFLRRATGAPI